MPPIPGAPWTGPSVEEMLRQHTLAHNIITHHDDPCPVFDGASLAFLREYIEDPSTANAINILAERDMKDEEGEELGAGALRKGSLIGYIIAKELRGETVLDAGEKAALQQWYADGKAEERIRDWREGRGE